MESLNPVTVLVAYFVAGIIGLGFAATTLSWLGLLVYRARDEHMKRRKTGNGATLTVDMGQGGDLPSGDYIKIVNSGNEK